MMNTYCSQTQKNMIVAENHSFALNILLAVLETWYDYSLFSCKNDDLLGAGKT